MSSTLLQVALAFCLTLFFIWALSPIAVRIGLADTPDHRKQHNGSVPLVGGIAIFLSLVVTAFVSEYLEAQVPKREILNVFLSGGGMLVVLGVADDRFHLSVFTRVLAEVSVALFVIESLDLRLAHLGDLAGLGKIRLNDWLSYSFTVLFIFVVINAYNMLDGMDGLLGIIILVTIFAFHLFSGLAPGLVSIVISAALVAFLTSNLRLAPFIPRSFLGDAGSKLLGFIVVILILSVTAAQVGDVRRIQPVTALYLLGLPLFDMAFTTLRRVLQGKSPIRADNTHIHHMMQALEISERRALVLLGTVGASIPFLGLMLARAAIPESYQFGILVGAFLLYCVIASQAWHVARNQTRNNAQRSISPVKSPEGLS